MSFTVIIPARYQATRFPGKLLQKIFGKTVLEHTWRVAQQSDASKVIIAVDDDRLAQEAKRFGATVCMTEQNLESGTDRVHAAAQSYCQENDVIINLQADEPGSHWQDINNLAQALTAEEEMVSMMRRFGEDESPDNPNQVKVVVDDNNHALYFSRATIPFCRNPGYHFHHLGMYGYRKAFLDQFVRWPPATLEKIEQLEQLRALANGVRIKLIESEQPYTIGVDTLSDVAIVENMLRERNN